jgi:hypothetical protein
MNVVCCIIQRGDGKVLIGKHADGVCKGKWGIASLGAEFHRRPQECAAKLIEVCTMGILGKAGNTLTHKCMKQGRTRNGLLVYKIQTEHDALDEQITNVSSYVLRCFPKTGVPPGLVAWTKCKWIDATDTTHVDSYTVDALQFIMLAPVVDSPNMIQGYFE